MGERRRVPFEGEMFGPGTVAEGEKKEGKRLSRWAEKCMGSVRDETPSS